MKKAFIPALAALVLLTASSAQALTISYTYATPTDGSGKTSTFAGAGNTSTANAFVETFDGSPTGGQSLSTSQLAITFDPTKGSFGYAHGSSDNQYAAPAGDTTHYIYGPDASSSSSSAEVKFDYTGLLSTLGTDAKLNYFGLYYGSIDNFNDVTFYDVNGKVIQTITGASLITDNHGVPGNQVDPGSNVYINIFFTPEEEFASFVFNTSSRAFEADNLVVGYQLVDPTVVPEPASLALLGLGLAGLGFARRRASK